MDYRKAGEVTLSAITMGCMAIADQAVWGAQDEKESIHTIHAALDLGIISFDTAPGYGNGYSEEILGRALKGKQAVVADKVSPNKMGYHDCIAACEESLQRLQRDYIDLYQIHWPNPDIPMEDTARALLKLKEDGKIKEIGVSNFGVCDLSEMAKLCPVRTDQLAYNLFFRAVEHEIQPLCEEKNIGIMCYSSLAQGLLTGKFQSLDDVPETRARTRHFPSDKHAGAPHKEAGCQKEVEQALAELAVFSADAGITMEQAAISWLLCQKSVATVIAGARSVEQITQNTSGANVALNSQQLSQLSALSLNMKKKLGKNPDMWRTESRIC